MSKAARLELVKKIQAEMAKRVTSRELSEELKAAGADQSGTLDSDVWVDDEERGAVVLPAHIGLFCENSGTGKILCKAFHGDELWERLPMGTRLMKVLGGYAVELYETTVSLGAYPNSPVSMLGQLYLWCLQNGRCEKAEGGS